MIYMTWIIVLLSYLIFILDPPGSKICPRTYKFLWGVANKCWILDYQWILDSNEAGKSLPEVS